MHASIRILRDCQKAHCKEINRMLRLNLKTDAKVTQSYYNQTLFVLTVDYLL